jgi:threonylcarbamoyladenosine tRNA methylthiotransferase MtaB
MLTQPKTLTGQKYLLKTLGCKANLYDSQLIEAELQKKGWKPAISESEADLCIVNSCTVTDEADRQSVRMAKQAVKKNQNIKVVMTGCGAEVDPGKLIQNKNIHFVVGNQSKNRLVDLVLDSLEKSESHILGGVTDYSEMLSQHPIDREWATPEASFMLPPVHLAGEAGRTRSFIKIQEGCNSFCTYCIIPYGRGPSRSLSIQKIIDQVSELEAQGAQEVIITGTNIGEYGVDFNPQSAEPDFQLEPLLKNILTLTKISRLRVSSLDPSEITPSLISLMTENPRFCPHFHVSLQSPHSKILRLMKRKYSSTEVERALFEISSIPAPLGGPFVGMDVITGFPGETDEIFEESFSSLERLPWTRLHVFPYSERAGTPATRLPNPVSEPTRVARARRLRMLSLERMKKIHQEALDQSQKMRRPFDQVLMESITRGPDPSKFWVGGYTPHYLRVLVPFESEAEAQFVKNKLISVWPESLLVDSNQGDMAFLAKLNHF